MQAKRGYQGRIQDFKLGGAYFKKLRQAEGGANIFGVFHVKNHRFTQKNHIFSNFRGSAPTSQITLSKRSDNVTFSLLQRKNFTF